MSILDLNPSLNGGTNEIEFMVVSEFGPSRSSGNELEQARDRGRRVRTVGSTVATLRLKPGFRLKAVLQTLPIGYATILLPW